MTLPTLLQQAAIVFQRVDGSAAKQTAAVLRQVTALTPSDSAGQIAPGEAEVSPPAALARLLLASATDEPTSIYAALNDTYRDLDWFASGRATAAAYTQLVGPGSHYDYDAARIGLFALPANYDYANHVHGADEIYVVMAGQADWSVDHQPYEPKTVGDVITIPSMTVHALRTHQEPALLMWSWTGDITLDRYQFVD